MTSSGCFVEIGEKRIYDIRAKVDDFEDSKTSGCKTENTAWERLRCRLDRNNEMFVYDVEPKNLDQRVSAVTQIERMYSVGVGARVQAGGQLAQGGGGAQTQNGRQLDEVEDHAIVLPLGEGASSVQDHGPHSISFGWVVAPRIGVEPTERRQIDGTYSLSAVISAPSWWGSLLATYTMCWIDPAAIASVQNLNGFWSSERIGEICGKDREGHTTPDLIRLPHGAADITRKLGFELPEAPHLDNRQSSSVLIAGHPGDLLLEGDRLWRSTDVFLDSQRADSIRVLPDMKGIVAHFNCVLPFVTDPAAPPTRPTVAVVTSEGRGDLAVAPPLVVQPAIERGTSERSKPPDPAAAAASNAVEAAKLIQRCASVAEKGWAPALENELVQTEKTQALQPKQLKNAQSERQN